MSDKPVDGIANQLYGFVDAVVVHGGQVGEADMAAADVEDADLHEAACEFNAYEVVRVVVEGQSDGASVFAAFKIACFFDNACVKQLCGDFGDCGGGKAQRFCDLCTGADAVAIEVLQYAEPIGFGHCGLLCVGVGHMTPPLLSYLRFPFNV